MVFQQRLSHKIIAFIIIALQLSSCSGNRWVTTYDQTIELKPESKVFINQKNQNYYYELYDAQALNNKLQGYIIIEDEINTVPRELEYLVVYLDSQLSIDEVDSMNVSMPFESIIKVRAFEYDKGVKNTRTIALVVVPLILVAIIYHEINTMTLSPFGTPN